MLIDTETPLVGEAELRLGEPKVSDWQVIAKRKQDERQNLIPLPWRIPDLVLREYVECPIAAFREPLHEAISPGILSQKEINLTNPNRDAMDLVVLLRQGDVSCEEVVTAFCKRAAIAHQLTNCLSEIMFEVAIAKAKEVDQLVQNSSSRSELTHILSGLPITVKDCFHIKGYDTSCGISSLCYDPATTNSGMVNILQSYGAIIIAKTTVPQTMLTADTDSIVFGRTRNVHRGDFGAGGSSGGEAVVLAMGGSGMGVGTDGAGSVRMPSFVNGVVGFKPSGYRMPLDGRSIFGRGLMGTVSLGPVSVTGLIVRSVRDARVMTQLISEAEPWKTNPFLLPSPWRNVRLSPVRDMPLRLGVWKTHDHVHLLPPVARAFSLAQERLQAAGHVLVEFEGPSLTTVWSSQKEWTELQDLRPLRDMISTEPMTTIVRNTKILEPGVPIPEINLDRIHELNIRLSALVTDMVKAWTRSGHLDALLWVPAAHPALPFDEYTDLGLTGLFNMIDWPAIVLPMREYVDPRRDFDSNLKIKTEVLLSETDRRLQEIYFGPEQSKFANLPLSMQLIGRRGDDERLLNIAEAVHSIIRPSS